MQSSNINRTSKAVCTLINGFEVNPKSFYSTKLISEKIDISIKKINQLLKTGEIEYKRVGNRREIYGYSLINWLNQKSEK